MSSSRTINALCFFIILFTAVRIDFFKPIFLFFLYIITFLNPDILQIIFLTFSTFFFSLIFFGPSLKTYRIVFFAR